MKTYKVGVLAATGAVGQKFVRLLEGHPWFRLAEVYASERSAGKTYAQAVPWLQETPIPKEAAGLEVKGEGADLDADILFSAIPGGQAGPVERAYAKAGHAVFTNARDLRMEADVPLVIAEVNADHLGLIDVQRKASGSDGFVVANGNCTTITMAMTLKPIQDAFGLRRVSMVSMQAVSGAGYPGVASLDILGNVVPFIKDEEERVAMEGPRFLGTLRGEAVLPADFALAATCTRVPVIEGHTEVISVATSKPATPEAVAAAFSSFRGLPQAKKLPSAPPHPIVVRPEPDRPQPRKDEGAGGGMVTSVGRIARDSVVDGIRYVALSSNTVRGAAGGSILNAEMCLADAYIR